MTGSTAEILLPDIHELREAVMPWRSSLSEEYSDEFVELWWCDTVRQLADNLTKLVTPSTFDFMEVLRTGVIKLNGSSGVKTYERPRATQRAHSFWGSFLGYLGIWDSPEQADLALAVEGRSNVA